ncbi:MAG TPA: GAF domain-containing protein, partial [Anaeromyxobacteraceae bacterium]|nr:GAF domain-containing protein [Anaeromyxobacteraceae bacterium]
MLLDLGDRTERRRRLDRAWQAFVQRGELEQIRPEIARSWTRTRHFHGVDPAMRQAPLLGEEELVRRREQSDLLEIATPVLDDFSTRLREQGHVLAFFDGGGCMLAMGGDPAVIDRVTEANFCPGASWREDTAGTNGPGTALAERGAIEVFASEHYVQAFQDWSCIAAPIVVPGASEPLGVVDITGPWDSREPQALLGASAIASIVEERVRAIQTVRAETIRYALRCARAAG